METTVAESGQCLLAAHAAEVPQFSATYEDALHFRPDVSVEVLGLTAANRAATTGPFIWIGPAAQRIPVGGTYAFPAAGPNEYLSDNDIQYHVESGFWEKAGAMTRGAALRAAPEGGPRGGRIFLGRWGRMKPFKACRDPVRGTNVSQSPRLTSVVA